MSDADTQRPLFTVVMCVRDGEALIGDALESLARQTHDSFEVIVVDDGSTDATPKIVAASPVVTMTLDVDGAGIAVARNTALAVARGRYVTFLDHDDLYHPTRLARLADWLSSHDYPPAVYTGLTVFTESDEVAVPERWERLASTWPRLRIASGAVLDTVTALPEPAPADNGVELDLTDDGLLVGAAPGPALVVERKLLMAAGGSPVQFERASDYLMMINLTRLTTIVEIAQPSYFYRVRPDSVTRRGGAHWPYMAAVLSTRFGGMRMDILRAAGRGAPLPRDLIFEDLLATEVKRGFQPGELWLLMHTVALMYPRWRERLPLARRLVRDAVYERAPSLGRAVSRLANRS